MRSEPRRCCMSKPKIRQGDWVVVCDGKKALVLENIGNAKVLNLKTREVYEQPDPKTHELGTDAPGRSFASVGTARGAVEQTDWHDQEEQRFLHQLTEHLDAAVIAGKAKSVVMVAPPRARRAPPLLFPTSAQRRARRDRQGFRQAAGVGDRETPRGVALK